MNDAFMTIGSIAIVLCAVWFLTKPFWGEKIKHAFISKKSPAAVVKIILKKDFSSKCARCTFYMNNDYDNEYSQSEWTELFKEQVLDKELDADSEEYTKAVAPFVNAIVVSDTGFYMRRGLEDLDRQLERFMPGVNDRISLNYFLEPYEYYKHKTTKQTQAEQDYKDTSTEKGSDLLERSQAKRELFFAQKRYRDATAARVKHKGTIHEGIYEAREKEAFAKMLSAQMKYDNCK